MRLVYLGTPDMAVPPLEALADAGHDIALVVTRPDKRRGRGSATSPSPVKAAANRLGLVVSHDVGDATTVGAALGVVVAFGQIIRPHVLDVLPMVNLHFSLLPRWRGAAPVERAILAGDEMTGVCLMDVEQGLDTGGVHARVDVAIGSDTTSDELRLELVEVGTTLLVESLDRGLTEARPQLGSPLYAGKIHVDELRIAWDRPAVETYRLVRIGGAWTTFRGARFKIHGAKMVDGELMLTEVQPEGKPRMTYSAWRNGARPGPGEWFE